MIHAIVALCFLCSHQDRAYNASRLALYSGAAFDTVTTVVLPGRESNPILGQDHARLAVAEVGLTAVSTWATRSLDKSGHRKAATVMNFVTGSFHFAAGSWNIHAKQYSQ